MKKSQTRAVVLLSSSLALISIIIFAVPSIRKHAKALIVAHACEWRLISETTCYPDTSEASPFGDIIDEVVRQRELEQELAPIIAEQNAITAQRREWEKNAQSIERDRQKAFVIGCERDKLARMQEGKDVTGLDCRKGSGFR